MSGVGQACGEIMQLILKDDLPFVAVQVAYQGRTIIVPDMLVDTGSACTALAADVVANIGIVPAPADPLRRVRGIGGTEVVFVRRVAYLQADHRRLHDFEIEVGGLDYGLGLNGILGMDFLKAAGAKIDLAQMTIEFTA